jgi:4,5-DOPA dioxygenase extradiol
MTNLMPAVFFGHGNPMNAVLHNGYTEAWAALGRQIPRPKAILCVSAHWFLPETGVTVSTPRTIHDFGGFSRGALRGIVSGSRRPGAGAVGSESAGAAARQARSKLGSRSWNLVGDAPRLSRCRCPGGPTQYRRKAAGQLSYEIGERLAPLREEGGLIAVSGSGSQSARVRLGEARRPGVERIGRDLPRRAALPGLAPQLGPS